MLHDEVCVKGALPPLSNSGSRVRWMVLSTRSDFAANRPQRRFSPELGGGKGVGMKDEDEDDGEDEDKRESGSYRRRSPARHPRRISSIHSSPWWNPRHFLFSHHKPQKYAERNIAIKYKPFLPHPKTLAIPPPTPQTGLSLFIFVVCFFRRIPTSMITFRF
jgi:hypothetical protein